MLKGWGFGGRPQESFFAGWRLGWGFKREKCVAGLLDLPRTLLIPRLRLDRSSPGGRMEERAPWENGKEMRGMHPI